MVNFSKSNPTGRFSGLADIYAKFRPSYPDEAIQFILERCKLVEESLLVDIGSGTGISSRLFAGRGLHVIGVEPNADMRAKADAEISDDLRACLFYVDGQAETTGLPAASADAVLCAQSFHWFDPAKALAEFHRILKPDGWTVLIWNERDASDEFTLAYGDFMHQFSLLHTVEGTKSLEVERGLSGVALLKSDLFGDSSRTVFNNSQILDADGLVGRAFSASYAPKENVAAQNFEAAIRDLFARFEKSGSVNIIYETSVYCARRQK